MWYAAVWLLAILNGNLFDCILIYSWVNVAFFKKNSFDKTFYCLFTYISHCCSLWPNVCQLLLTKDKTLWPGHSWLHAVSVLLQLGTWTFHLLRILRVDLATLLADIPAETKLNCRPLKCWRTSAIHQQALTSQCYICASTCSSIKSYKPTNWGFFLHILNTCWWNILINRPAGVRISFYTFKTRSWSEIYAANRLRCDICKMFSMWNLQVPFFPRIDLSPSRNMRGRLAYPRFCSLAFRTCICFSFAVPHPGILQ